MTDRRRREAIARYLDGTMPGEEASAFRKRLECDAGLRRLLEAEQLIRHTFEQRNRPDPAPDHAFTRKRVMAILATLPPAKSSSVLKGTTAGISQIAKATLFTVFGVGAVVIATQLAERPAAGGSAAGVADDRYRTERTTSARRQPGTPAAMPVPGTTKRAVAQGEDPATESQIRETAAPQHRTSPDAKRGGVQTAPPDADRVRSSADAAADDNVHPIEPQSPTAAAVPRPARRPLPVLRSDSVNVRVRINIHK